MLDHLTSILKCKQINMTQNIQESSELNLRYLLEHRGTSNEKQDFSF